MAERSYESASLGETSADELILVSNSASSGDLEVYRDSEVSKQYEEAKMIAGEVEQYEKEIVEKHL